MDSTVTGSKNIGQRGKPRNLRAFTGTLRTMPSEINVGYVIAMPKFTRTLKAARGSRIRAAASYTLTVSNHKTCKRIFMGHITITVCTVLLHMASFHTKKQACNPTEVGPGDVFRRANVLHLCKIQDDRHKADENEVGASNDAQEECSLSKFGTAQDHFEEHLRMKQDQRDECNKSAPLRSRGLLQRGHLPSARHVSGTGPLLSVYHIRQDRQQGRGDQSPVKI